MKKTKLSNDMGKIYKDILAIEITMNDSFQSMLDKFYDVMRKYSICQGTWTSTECSSRTMCNPEWSVCFKTFIMHKQSAIELDMLLAEPPEDLLAYDKKVNSNKNEKN